MSTRPPPGQQEIDFLPRYGLFQYAGRIDSQQASLRLEVGGDVAEKVVLEAEALAALPRV